MSWFRWRRWKRKRAIREQLARITEKTVYVGAPGGLIRCGALLRHRTNGGLENETTISIPMKAGACPRRMEIWDHPTGGNLLATAPLYSGLVLFESRGDIMQVSPGKLTISLEPAP